MQNNTATLLVHGINVGDKGARGYKGDDPCPENLCWDFLKGHSDIFTEENMNVVGPQLAMQLYPEAVSV